MPCIGRGQRRFKFLDENEKLEARNRGLLAKSNLPRTPSNELSKLTLAFIFHLDPSIDISVQWISNFGSFLCEVPRHLGTNKALDAASDLMVTSYTSHCAGNFKPTVETLGKQSKALQELQICLSDPLKAHTSETLCATALLAMTHVRQLQSIREWTNRRSRSL